MKKSITSSIERIERNTKIRQMRKSGMTLKEIGLAFGLTGERVRQIVAQHIAGHDPNEHRQQMYMDIKNHLAELGKRLGRMPRKKDIEAEGKYNISQICNHFGNFSNAREQAGVQEPYKYEQLRQQRALKRWGKP